jgi:hypothetical protein
MEKKSLLERTNSWKPFIDEIQGAIKAKDYRKQTVETILHIVDPDLSMWPGSIWRYVRGNLIGIGFPYGRSCLYEHPFSEFMARKGKVFENAPLAAIQGFNSFVSFLFPEEISSQFIVDESLSRKRLSKIEESLRQEERAKAAIIEWSFARAREFESSERTAKEKKQEAPELPPELISEELKPEGPPPLFSETSVLDSATKERIEQTIAASSLTADESDSQRPHERQVIALLERAVNRALLVRQNTLITLGSPQFFRFKDLLEQAKKGGVFSLDDDFLLSCFQEPDIAKVSRLINDRLSKYEKWFTPLIEKADTRTKLIKEIGKETSRLKDLISPYMQKKELKSQAELLLNQLAIIQIPDELFDENTDIIERTIEKERERLNTTSARIESQFREFILKTRELTRSADFLQMMLLAARWELISTSTPYPDLRLTIARIRNQLLQSLEKGRQELIIGKVSLSDYAESIVSAVYETDVKLVRGELSARSLRLKDLRDPILQQLRALDRAMSLLTLSGHITEKAVVDREWLAHFLYRLIEPFQLFKDTFDPESINILFRYWWMDVERFLRGKESRYYGFLHSIEEGASRILRPIARTLDAIEKIKGAGRLNLYQQFADATQGKTGIEAASAVDQWLRGEEKGLLGSFIPQLSLIPQTDQEQLIERLLQIEERIRDVTQFAKAIQAVKTFEPERIDSLLEVFSIFSFVKSFDPPPLIRLQIQIEGMEESIQKIEEELVIELGLLDKKSRMESGLAISNLIPHALLKIPSIITFLSARLHALSQLTDPYVSSIAHFLNEETTQLSQSLETIGFDQGQLFSAFQRLSVLLFHRRMLDNAIHQKNFARILLLPSATGQIVKRFRNMEAKGELSFVGTLIDELDALTSSQWNIMAPDLIQKDSIMQRLQKFIVLAKRIIATSGLTERREAHLITGIEKVCQELSEETCYEIPRLSFVPGDLAYLWHPKEPSV